MYCVLHITVLCNVGVTEEVCTPSVTTRLLLRSAHFTESRQERRNHDNQDDGTNISEMRDAEEVGAGLCPGRQGVKSCVVN